MKLIRNISWAITAVTVLWGSTIDDAMFSYSLGMALLSGLFTFIVYSEKKDAPPQKKAVPQLQAFSPGHMQRLVDLLLRKGVITMDDLEEAGIMTSKSPHVQPSVEQHASESTEQAHVQVSHSTPPIAAIRENISMQKPEAPESTEFAISGNLLVWVGVVAVFLGVGFFLKYSFDNHLIGETGRVILGLISGCALLGLGEFLRGKYAKYAEMLSGAGISLLYLSLYGTLYYEITQPLVTLFFMGLVTAASLMLSVRYQSVGIAILGFVGGYGTPLFFGRLAAGLGGLVLLNYLVILNVGVLVLSYFKNWRPALWAGFAGTALLMTGWLQSSLYDPSKLGVAVVYLSVFWVLFTCAILIFYYFHDREPDGSDMVLMGVVGLYPALQVYALFADVYGRSQDFYGIIPLVLAAAYVGVSYIGSVLRPQKRSLVIFPMALAALFITLVFPFEFEGKMLAVAWLAEAVVIGFAALGLRSVALARFAMPVYVLGLFFLAINTYSLSATKPIFNERFFLYLFAAASAFCLMYVFSQLRKMSAAVDTQSILLESSDKTIDARDVQRSSYFTLANVLIGCVVASEVLVFGKYIGISGHTFFAVLNARFLILLLAAIYAYGVIFVNVQKGESPRFGSQALNAFIAANLLIFVSGMLELGNYYQFREEYQLIWNARSLIFAIEIGYVAVACSLAYRGMKNVFKPVPSIGNILFVVLNALALTWGVLEIVDYHSRILSLVPGAANVMQQASMYVSLFFVVYGFGALVVGLLSNFILLRKIAVMILGMAVVKVFLMDIWMLDTVYRIVALLFLGVTLLVVGYLYYRYKERIISIVTHDA